MDAAPIMRNVTVYGRVEMDGFVEGGSVTDCTFYPALRARRPRFMPERVARFLRTLVAEPDYPAIRINR